MLEITYSLRKQSDPFIARKKYFVLRTQLLFFDKEIFIHYVSLELCYTQITHILNIKGFRKNNETRNTKSYPSFIQSVPNDRGAHSRSVRCQTAGNLQQIMTDELLYSNYLFQKKLFLVFNFKTPADRSSLLQNVNS